MPRRDSRNRERAHAHQDQEEAALQAEEDGQEQTSIHRVENTTPESWPSQ